MSGLVLAIPSKGRLQADALDLMSRAGLAVEMQGGARAYRGVLRHRDGEPAGEVALLSASEIARELGHGAVHLGVTGEDVVRESVAEWEARVRLVLPLGFGRADVVVAVPEAWVDVATMEDLDDVAAAFRARHRRRLRIATKYWNLTLGFFASHGIALYRVVESLGATEGAPAAGLADAIVDITSTGSTLKANHLKVLEDGVILRSQAHLARSLTAAWTDAQEMAARELAAALDAARNDSSIFSGATA
jgi:ATP phosphoribosyltransferase